MGATQQRERDAQFLVEGAVDELIEGTDERTGKPLQQVWVTLIREGRGNRRDRHYYPAPALEQAADLFEGAQMYVNHLDPETAKKLNGYPRDVRELAGRIRETRMGVNEDGVPALQGRVSISQPWLWQMVEHDPELVAVSINARGNSRPGEAPDGSGPAKIVEGINRVVSVDWVTQAGAGGKVIGFVEAQLREEGREDEIMGIEQLTEDERSSEQLDEEQEAHQGDPEDFNITPGMVDGAAGQGPHSPNAQTQRGRMAPTGQFRSRQNFRGGLRDPLDSIQHDMGQRDLLPGGDSDAHLGRGHATTRSSSYEAMLDAETEAALAELDALEPLDDGEYDIEAELDAIEAEAEPDEDEVECDVSYTHGQTGRRMRSRGHTRAHGHRVAEHLRRRGHRNVRVHEADAAELEDRFGEADYDDEFYEDDVDPAVAERNAELEDPSAQSEAEFQAELEARIEERAVEIAREHLREAVARAVESLRSNYEGQVRELKEGFARTLQQRDQREAASRIVESSGLPARSVEALKAEIYDSLFEAEVDPESGDVVKDADTVLKESVQAMIQARREELSVFTEARVTGAGPTATRNEGDGPQGSSESAPRRAPADEKVRRMVGVD